MKKYQILLMIIATIFYLLWSFFEYESFRKSKEVKLLDMNLTLVDIKKRVDINLEQIYKSNYKLWNLDINKILEERRKSEKEKHKAEPTQNSFGSLKLEKTANFNLKKRKICLEKKCWEFMGKVTIDNHVKVTLLSTEKKPKLETFSIGDELLNGLFISKIKGDVMIVKDKKKDRKFVLKLFDVNVSAYFPKDRKESNE